MHLDVVHCIFQVRNNVSNTVCKKNRNFRNIFRFFSSDFVPGGDCQIIFKILGQPVIMFLIQKKVIILLYDPTSLPPSATMMETSSFFSLKINKFSIQLLLTFISTIWGRGVTPLTRSRGCRRPPKLSVSLVVIYQLLILVVHLAIVIHISVWYSIVKVTVWYEVQGLTVRSNIMDFFHCSCGLGYLNNKHQ